MLGKEFEVIDVSIDPHETPELALAKKRTYLKQYGRAGAEAGWHFLTGDESAIQQLTSEVGFHYAYDAPSKQYAHPKRLDHSLTPEGKGVPLYFGRHAMRRHCLNLCAMLPARKVGSPIQRLVLLCFHYSPITGKYGAVVMLIVRILAAATIFGLVWLITATIRDEKRRRALMEKVPRGSSAKNHPARMKFPVFPDEASAAARQTDYLYWGLIFLSALTMLVVFGPILVFLFKYRRGKKADRRPVQLPEMKIEIAWTIIPMILFTGLFAWGTGVYWAIRTAAAGCNGYQCRGQAMDVENPASGRQTRDR